MNVYAVSLEHMGQPIHTKFNIQDCMLTINMITKNDLDWITGCGTSHISKIGILRSFAHETSGSHQI